VDPATAEPRGFRLRIFRAAIPLAVIFAAIVGATAGRAVEAVNVRLDAPAIDLTDVIDRQRTESDRIQVSIAPGPDGIVPAPTGPWWRSPTTATSRSRGF
jgi:hypothetical protein